MSENIEFKQQIKEMLETLIEASSEIKGLLERESWDVFFEVSRNMIQMCLTISKSVDGREEAYYDVLWKTIGNIQYSLINIMQKAREEKNNILKKIEFELNPLCRIANLQFCYCAIIEPNNDIRDNWLDNEGLDLCKNEYIEKSKITGKYKYELSIIVLAYNKLEYTKKCVESVLKNIPQTISYELILINHGSTDETKEYFESIHPDKQIDLKYNGGGVLMELYVYEGKYLITVSNDVIVTPNTFEIMYKTLENNRKIGMAVPMTANISNLQTPQDNGLSIEYNSIEELMSVTNIFNKYDDRLNETRYRLCTPIYIMRNELIAESGVYWLKFSNILMFSDDMLSLFWRRYGYINVLMKSIYCHHFGSITIKDSKLTEEQYAKARAEYLKLWGVDPWGKGFCWSYELFDNLICDKKDSNKILGIDCGMGSNPLKIQQELKEKVGNDTVEIINFTKKERYKKELEGISDKVYLYSNWNELRESLESSYDYIIIEELDIKEDYEKFIDALFNRTIVNGKLIVFVNDKQDIIEQWIRSKYRNKIQITDSFDIFYEIDDVITKDTPRRGKYFIVAKEN